MCNQERKPLVNIKKIGLLLVIVSWIIYSLIFIIPFLPLDFELQLIICATLYLSSHISFWIGALILGKEIIGKLKAVNLLKRLLGMEIKENKPK